MAGSIGDGTGRYCFDTFGGIFFQDGTRRDGKILKIIVAWMGRDWTVGVNFLDGTLGISFVPGRRDGTVGAGVVNGTGR